MALALPMVAVLVAQMLVGVAETFYIGRLGTDALAGAALVFPLSMLMTMMSNGGIGGGVASAVARATGAGHHADADALLWHALGLAVVFGTAFVGAALFLGPRLYGAMGGRDEVLAVAVTYSDYVFAASVPIWLVNLMAAALRGVGNVRVPAVVTLVGSLILIPLSPLLIFGFGPLPRFGVAGAGIAIMIYYVGATIYLGSYLCSGRGGLTLRLSPLRWDLFASILGVGLISAVGAVLSNLTVIVVTGLVGALGAEAIAGYGAASRLDYVQIPILFGLGTAVVTMVGVNIGAGQHARARRIAWTGALIAALVTEIIGLFAALAPDVWNGIFSRDPGVLAAGATYLHRVGPAYGAVGLGMLLYFAAQGTGRMLVPFLASLARLGVSVGIGWIAVHQFKAGLPALFLMVAAGALAFGAINALGAFGGWSLPGATRKAAASAEPEEGEAPRPARKKWRIVGPRTAIGAVIALAVGAAAAFALADKKEVKPVAARPPVVRTMIVAPASTGRTRYTGVVHARYESNLGFRVAGKIMERLVDPGDHVTVGQPLMKLDETDFALALKSARSAVEAARATSLQATSDERRRRALVDRGWVSQQAYERNKSSADSSVAQLASALSQEHQAENQLSYAVLRADSDGVIMSVPGEPGQVVAAGQAVVQLAHDGSREAEIYIPEGEQHAARAPTTAQLYAGSDRSDPAKLRELSARADPATRTYRARYVLDGKGKDAAIGATVTVNLWDPRRSLFSVPIGAIFDKGTGPSVWVVDPTSRTLTRRQVVVAAMGEEQAEIKSGLNGGEEVVTLGVQLLRPGEKVTVDAAQLNTAAR